MRVVATAGHVDHGKSTLLRALTGMEPDRWEEERRRGLTIDLGYVWTRMELPGEGVDDVAFVDVPGHQGFIANMLAGMSVVDDALLVVAADDGWAPQSQEHLDVIRLLGVRVLAAAVTRADLVDEDRADEVVADVRRRLAEVGQDDVPVLPVAAPTAVGLDELRTTLAARLAGRAVESIGARHLRLHVDRAFSPQGAGTVVTGMVRRGRIRVGDEIRLLPSGPTTKVRALQQLGGAVEDAAEGSRVAVQLGRIPLEDVARGSVVVDAAAPVAPEGTRAIDVALDVLEQVAVGRTGAWHLHLATAFSSVRVVPFVGEVGPGQRGPVRLLLDRPVAAWTGDRFVLRESGRGATVAGGQVLDPSPLLLPDGADARFEHALVLEELDRAHDDTARTVGLVDAHRGVRSREGIRIALGLPDGAPSPDAPGLRPLGGALVRDELVTGWLDAIAACAQQGPAEHGVERSELARHAQQAGCPTDLARAAVDLAHDEGALRGFGSRSVHVDDVERYVAARDRRAHELLGLLSTDPLEPPDPDVVTTAASIPSGEVQRLLDAGDVVACGPLLFTADAVATAVRLLRDGPGSGGRSFSASEARLAWGTTRRCAVPLLEHLRTTGITRFDGEAHTLAS